MKVSQGTITYVLFIFDKLVDFPLSHVRLQSGFEQNLVVFFPRSKDWICFVEDPRCYFMCGGLAI